MLLALAALVSLGLSVVGLAVLAAPPGYGMAYVGGGFLVLLLALSVVRDRQACAEGVDDHDPVCAGRSMPGSAPGPCPLGLAVPIVRWLREASSVTSRDLRTSHHRHRPVERLSR